MNKKIILAGLLTLASVAGVVGTVGNASKVDAAQLKMIYLKPNSNWKQSNAWFMARVWPASGSDKWYKMNDPDGDGIYEAEIDVATYPNVIFCRMNSGASSEGWSNVWNQSSDLKFPSNSNNMYTISEGAWSKGSGTWSTHVVETPEEPVVRNASEEVQSLFDEYYNEGIYKKETEIKLDKNAASYDKCIFHAESEILNRTTYYNKDELWMSRGENSTTYSYYGTSYDANGEANGVTNGGVELYKTASTVVLSGENKNSMEEYYKTLYDLKTFTNTNQWEFKDSNKIIYKSTNPTLIDIFKNFTAPCFVGNGTTANGVNISNYVQYDRVEVENTSTGLELRLYVSSGNSGLVTSSDCLLSKATITYSQWYLVGEMNNWSPSIQYAMEAQPDTNAADQQKITFTIDEEAEYKITNTNKDKWFGYNAVENKTAVAKGTEEYGDANIKLAAGSYTLYLKPSWESNNIWVA